MDGFKQLYPIDIEGLQGFQSLSSLITSHGKTVVDLLDYANDNHVQLAKLTGRSIREIDEFLKYIVAECNSRVSPIRGSDLLKSSTNRFISTGLPSLDKQLGGGIPQGEITEIFGASGCGKSHLLAQLALQCQLNSKEKNECIHIATESFLETKRIRDFQRAYSNSKNDVTMDNISYIYCQDLESQDHIVYTQLPIKLEQSQGKIRLILIDSIAQHLRREGSIANTTYLEDRISQQEALLKDCKDFQAIRLKQEQNLKKIHKSAKYRNRVTKLHYLFLLQCHLYSLAKMHDVAIVLVNQVSDHTNQKIVTSNFPEDELNDPLNMDFQLGIHSGWDMKTIYNYQSHQGVEVNEREVEVMESELRKAITDNPNKRQKSNEEEILDPKYGINEPNFERVNELLLKMHRTSNIETKRIVPTLGYPWSVRIPIRILLMKTYRPQLEVKDRKKSFIGTDTDSDPTYDTLGFSLDKPDAENETYSSNKRKKNYPNPYHTTIESMINGWKLERYAKVVYSTYNLNSSNNMKVQFSIDELGVHEITNISS
ncbi:P-loop containing nucleoside triphosphate hydrolase protein [Scheffersomyces xylosifermentans]|uniref:P-loop containing nucleoside triphosphate hydrolase protein n=1 Tax=Scheffersomyces xylosifermentans TaxID=1304137 RepID=UPI00315D39B6